MKIHGTCTTYNYNSISSNAPPLEPNFSIKSLGNAPPKHICEVGLNVDRCINFTMTYVATPQLSDCITYMQVLSAISCTVAQAAEP